MIDRLPVWDMLMKKVVFKQIGNINGKDILDFGSGVGAAACYYAASNNVTAIEPDIDSVNARFKDNDYTQLVGSLDVLRTLKSESYDLIICHNVLEYVTDDISLNEVPVREQIVGEFYRLLKKGGRLSVVKHNRYGRVMQMAVLLNDFDAANRILDGENSCSAKFGVINYYDDNDIVGWCKDFDIKSIFGIRTFWDLQQNQEIQKSHDWQEKMIDLEMRVSDIDEFRNIAFFHHIVFCK